MSNFTVKVPKLFAYLIPLMSETLAVAWAWSESSSPVSCSELMSESVDCCDCCLLGVGDRDEKPESELELQDTSDLHAT